MGILTMEWDAFCKDLDAYSASDVEQIQTAFHLSQQQYLEHALHSFTDAISLAQLLLSQNADADTLSAGLLYFPILAGHLSTEDVRMAIGPSSALMIESVLPHSDSYSTLQKHLTLMLGDARILILALCERVITLKQESMTKDTKQCARFYVQLARLLSLNDIADKLEAVVFPTNAQTKPSTDSIDETTSVLESAFSGENIDIIYNSTQDDVLTFSIICASRDDCYAMWANLHASFRFVDGSFTDTINTPSFDGTEGLSTTLICKNGRRMHCTIQTRQMYNFSRTGVSTLCFSSEPPSLEDFFPWMQRLEGILQATKQNAKRCIQAVAEELLKPHIVILGPDDSVIWVPEGSSVLDAAFIAIGDKALSIETLYTNGKETRFYAAISCDMRVTWKLGTSTTATKRWLSYVHTFTAAHHIQMLLGNTSRKKRIEVGRELLQQELFAANKGFLEEYTDTSFAASLQDLECETLDDVCVAIADGDIALQTAFAALFEPDQGELKSIACRIRCIVQPDSNAMESVLSTFHQWNTSIDAIRIKGSHLSIRASLTTAQQALMHEVLSKAGACCIVVQHKNASIRLTLEIAAIWVLWGLDPVLSKVLLLEPVSLKPLDFTFARFIGFFLFCSVILTLSKIRNTSVFQKIPWNDVSLWGSGIFLWLTAIATYVSLQTLLPQQYITLTYTSAVLIPLLCNIFYKKSRWKHGILFGAILAGTSALLVVARPSISMEGLLSGVVAVVGFSLFTACTDVYKKRNAIRARLPAFFFAISFIALTCSVLAGAAYSYPTLHSSMLIGIVYALLFTCILYVLVYRVLRTEKWDTLRTYFTAATILTIITQYIVFRYIHLLSLIPLLACVTIYALYRIKQPSKLHRIHE